MHRRRDQTRDRIQFGAIIRRTLARLERLSLVEGNHVHVEVKHGLPRCRAAVGKNADAVGLEGRALRFGDPLRDEHHFRERHRVDAAGQSGGLLAGLRVPQAERAVRPTEAGELLRKLMKQSGFEAPPMGRTLESICITEACDTGN